MGLSDDRAENRRNQARYQKRGPRKPGKALLADMEIVLQLLAQGVSPTDAMAKVGRTYSTLHTAWLPRYPDFARRYHSALSKAQGNHVPTKVPFDAAFREHYFRFSTPRHLEVMMDAINHFTAEAQRDQEPKTLLILVPPNFAKSTLTEDWLSHQLATDPDLRCFFLSKTEGTAKKRVGRIMRRMTDMSLTPEFINDYGPFKSELRVDGKPWTARAFTVFHQSSGERDFSMEALGIGGHIYNVRADRIVADDIADLANQTPAEINKQLEYLQLEVRSRLTDPGVLVMIGTYIREAGLYQRLEELGFFDHIIKLPAIFGADYEHTLFSGEKVSWKQGESLWPERHPTKKLEKLKTRTDPRIWELSYQQQPLPSYGAIFPLEAIESCYDYSRFIGDVPSDCRVVAGVDPSVRNYTAGVVLAVAPSGMRYLVDVKNEKGLTGEGGDIARGLTEFIVGLCADYNVKTLALESNSTFALLSANLTLRSKLNDLGVYVMTPSIGPASGQREELALAQLSGLFTGGLISIPAGLEALGTLRPFIHQLSSWQPSQSQHKPQDMVKALRMAEMAARNEISSAEVHRVHDSSRPQYMKGKKLAAVV